MSSDNIDNIDNIDNELYNNFIKNFNNEGIYNYHDDLLFDIRDIFNKFKFIDKYNNLDLKNHIISFISKYNELLPELNELDNNIPEQDNVMYLFKNLSKRLKFVKIIDFVTYDNKLRNNYVLNDLSEEQVNHLKNLCEQKNLNEQTIEISKMCNLYSDVFENFRYNEFITFLNNNNFVENFKDKNNKNDKNNNEILRDYKIIRKGTKISEVYLTPRAFKIVLMKKSYTHDNHKYNQYFLTYEHVSVMYKKYITDYNKVSKQCENIYKNFMEKSSNIFVDELSKYKMLYNELLFNSIEKDTIIELNEFYEDEIKIFIKKMENELNSDLKDEDNIQFEYNIKKILKKITDIVNDKLKELITENIKYKNINDEFKNKIHKLELEQKYKPINTEEIDIMVEIDKQKRLEEELKNISEAYMKLEPAFKDLEYELGYTERQLEKANQSNEYLSNELKKANQTIENLKNNNHKTSMNIDKLVDTSVSSTTSNISKKTVSASKYIMLRRKYNILNENILMMCEDKNRYDVFIDLKKDFKDVSNELDELSDRYNELSEYNDTLLEKYNLIIEKYNKYKNLSKKYFDQINSNKK